MRCIVQFVNSFGHGVSAIFNNSITAVKKTNQLDYAVGYGSAFLITAFKLGNLNLIASAAAYATYNRVVSIYYESYGNREVTTNSNAVCKIVSALFAAAVYTGVSSLSLTSSLATVGAMYITEHFIRTGIRN